MPTRPSLKLTHLLAFLMTLVAASGCAPEETDANIGSDELESREFNRTLVLLDAAMVDYESMSAVEIQQFLEQTPYGNRSVLADHVSNGQSAAQAIYEAAVENRISPLVILTRTQMEQGLISKTTAGSNALSWAMGCGCPDNASCMSGYKGFDKQVACMAGLMRDYLDQIESDGETVAGWKVGVGKRTLDGYTVAPKNAATAALYTYTPWVQSNKLHASVWKKVATYVGYTPPAPGNCGVVSFGSDIVIQLVPDSGLSAQYGAGAPSCFLDPDLLMNPMGGTIYDPSVKIAANFRLSEFASASDSRRMLIEPGMVAKLQDVRSALGSSVRIELAYQSPAAQQAACNDGVTAACTSDDLSYGEGVVVSSSAGSQALMSAAASVGMPSCQTVSGGRVFLGVGSPALGCSP
jgi:hypothetical protein